MRNLRKDNRTGNKATRVLFGIGNSDPIDNSAHFGRTWIVGVLLAMVLTPSALVGQSSTSDPWREFPSYDVLIAMRLREGASAGEKDLRDFVAARLAQFKVPRAIVFLSVIPKGPTGKPQRIGLAKVLGLES